MSLEEIRFDLKCRKEEKIDRKANRRLYDTLSKFFYSGSIAKNDILGSTLATYKDYFKMRLDDNFGIYGSFKYEDYNCMFRIDHDTCLPDREDKKEGLGRDSYFVCEFYIPLPRDAVIPAKAEWEAQYFDDSPLNAIYGGYKRYYQRFNWDDDVERASIFEERFKASLDGFIFGINANRESIDIALGR